MSVHKLTDDISVASQISAEEVAALAQQGYRSIICNRPDGEWPGQPAFEDIARAAEPLGLIVSFIPVQSGAITEGDVRAFGEAVKRLPKPVLAYCRSGTRCAALWSLSEIGNRSAEDILMRTEAAGYDMRGVLQSLLNK